MTRSQHPEKLISAAGGFVGILLVLLVSAYFVGPTSASLVVASMGASAVLLFAAPHGPLSQPWPVFGGHLLSAVAGVTCCRFISDPRIAAPAAVGLAIGVMYYARCIHPPGGATALTAVLGGPALQELGYQYVFTPVLLNAVIILVVAVAVNAPFAWRRYPVAWARRAPPPRPEAPAISQEHLTFALRQMGPLLEVTEEELAELYAMAQHHAGGTHLSPTQIRLGGCYANGRADARWAIRQVVDEQPGATPEQDVVEYRVVAGYEGRGSGRCTRAALALWAREEVPPPVVAGAAEARVTARSAR
ncbi:HPP family protein [Hyalangium rubrum]|uniref:HPP family protein n=1 Tax=Hyalangium rubrum TaxID=3103134 RepID=A0ABU5H1E7_9BACT|nr:HPP family protein [Hyalangium sp. s54d21]MDY7227220.1 HPP family protein [Hyalangium sp. s54d21]